MTPLTATLRARPDAGTPAVAAVVADLEFRYGTGGEAAAFTAPVWLAYNHVLVAAVALDAAAADRPEVTGLAGQAVDLVLMLKGLALVGLKPIPAEACP